MQSARSKHVSLTNVFLLEMISSVSSEMPFRPLRMSSLVSSPVGSRPSANCFFQRCTGSFTLGFARLRRGAVVLFAENWCDPVAGQFVLNGIHQRTPARFDDIGRHANRAPLC